MWSFLLLLRWGTVRFSWDTGRLITLMTAAINCTGRLSSVRKVKWRPEIVWSYYMICHRSHIFTLSYVRVIQWCVAGWPDSVHVAGSRQGSRRSVTSSGSCREQRTWVCVLTTAWSSKTQPISHERTTAYGVTSAHHHLASDRNLWAKKKTRPKGETYRRKCVTFFFKYTHLNLK